MLTRTFPRWVLMTMTDCGPGESAFSGYQLLLEYFTFREKFMFVALNGLRTSSGRKG